MGNQQETGFESTGNWVCHHLEIIVVVSSKALALWLFSWKVMTPKVSVFFVLGLEKAGKSRQLSLLKYNYNYIIIIIQNHWILQVFFCPYSQEKKGFCWFTGETNSQPKLNFSRPVLGSLVILQGSLCLLICLIRLSKIQFFSYLYSLVFFERKKIVPKK